ncbi:G-type lectin S-receptor-like serine/threonine-protein kinase At1g11300 [Linum perenne]
MTANSSWTSELTTKQSLSRTDLKNEAVQTFALGFFSPDQNPIRRYLGIWYHGVSKQTVVWVANRDSPLNDSSGRLTLGGGERRRAAATEVGGGGRP